MIKRFLPLFNKLQPDIIFFDRAENEPATLTLRGKQYIVFGKMSGELIGLMHIPKTSNTEGEK